MKFKDRIKNKEVKIPIKHLKSLLNGENYFYNYIEDKDPYEEVLKSCVNLKGFEADYTAINIEDDEVSGKIHTIRVAADKIRKNISLTGISNMRVSVVHNDWRLSGIVPRLTENNNILLFETYKESLDELKDKRVDIEASFYKKGLESLNYEVNEVLVVCLCTDRIGDHEVLRLTKKDLKVGWEGKVVPSIHHRPPHGIELVAKEIKGVETLLETLEENNFINSNFWF